ncbi:succinate dehydrogenase, cytochrome b556 subunit [Sphingosinicella ginsenosidimutans]|uniref:Succinate dehydrogenase cytochrome b556 subunit n=1 Tax=Allosphingosinicella ginsenosidimutans TaxID=1176539 RepID=A0A5C6TRL5_9SPHN|nr:succinate dehydrogenase, cytochrome b556 subunit [Sphingosinicella ginsenosidimutans]TXC62876.1 succinate dehydrogenase, cytochrome b556 subunit [Sphingosinicella ginsenosidimutans]
MTRNPSRPLSPHLTIWKWGPHMAVSILHRITGVGLSVVGGVLFVWWLLAAASGPEAYASFVGWATWKWTLIVPIGLTWAFFQHLFSGLRHFVMDIGAGFELRTNRTWAIATMVGSVLLTALLWAWIILVRSA